jgi:hypothetical protein
MMMGEMPFFSYRKLWYSSYSKLLKVEEYKEENIGTLPNLERNRSL